jgi:hypothetical protein
MMMADIDDFYLGHLLPEKEYIKVHLNHIPQEIIAHHGLAALANKHGFVLLIVHKTMYGKQSGILSRQALVACLAGGGFHADPLTPTIFTHETRPISFLLIVDDFPIKCIHKEDADYLLDTLRQGGYKFKTDWDAKKALGLALTWDYTNRSVQISMPGYCEKALKRFDVVRSQRPVRSPTPYQAPIYGRSGAQPAADPDTSPPATAADTLRLQEVCGVFLYWARALDTISHFALSRLASQQGNPTEKTMAHVEIFLQYVAWDPHKSVTFHGSDMVLSAYSDASFASERDCRSRAAGVFMLGNKKDRIDDANIIPMPFHGSSIILSFVAPTTAEAEYGSAYTQGQTAIGMRNTLSAFGHPQDATVIKVDNSVASGIANKTIKQRKSKAIDIKYHWIRDQVSLGRLKIVWEKGILNLADYLTKAFPGSIIADIRRFFQDTPPRQLTAPSASRQRRSILRQQPAGSLKGCVGA